MEPRRSWLMRSAQRGFSLIELMIVVAVIALIAMIAIPNVQAALKKARRTSAYTNIKVLEGGMHAYMLEKDGPPDSINTVTLDPLVSGKFLTKQQRKAILASLDQNRLEWTWGWTGGGWWDYDYVICFRPKGDRPDTWCYLYPEGIWRYDETGYWQQVM